MPHDIAKVIEAAGIVWLTRREAADFARVSIRTIDRWLKNGLQHSGGAGEKKLIRLDWLETYIEKRGL